MSSYDPFYDCTKLLLVFLLYTKMNFPQFFLSFDSYFTSYLNENEQIKGTENSEFFFIVTVLISVGFEVKS